MMFARSTSLNGLASRGTSSGAPSGYAELPEGAPLEVPRLAKPFNDADLANMIAVVAG